MARQGATSAQKTSSRHQLLLLCNPLSFFFLVWRSVYSWYQDITIAKSFIEKEEDTTSLLTAEEMNFVLDTVSPEELKRMLSGGLDLDHFMVMMVRALTLSHSPSLSLYVRARLLASC